MLGTGVLEGSLPARTQSRLRDTGHLVDGHGVADLEGEEVGEEVLGSPLLGGWVEVGRATRDRVHGNPEPGEAQESDDASS